MYIVALLLEVVSLQPNVEICAFLRSLYPRRAAPLPVPDDDVLVITLLVPDDDVLVLSI